MDAACAATASVHAFDFDEQDRGAVERETGVDVVFDDAQRPAIEHLAGRGSDAARGDVGDGFRGVVDGVENGEKRLDGFRLAREFDGDFGDQSESAFGADEKTSEVVTGRRRRDCCQRERFRRRAGRVRAR